MTKMRRIGNSQGFIVPSDVLAAAEFQIDDEFDIHVEGDSLVITRATGEYQDAMDAYGDTVAAYRDTLRDLAK